MTLDLGPGRERGADVELPSVRVAFETARLRLAEIYAEGSETRLSAYKVATKHSAETLGVGRVSIWTLSKDGMTLTCELQYQDGDFIVSPGRTLTALAYPQYFRAIASRRVVVVKDARSDPRTEELLPYLEEFGIHSMLDAVIFRDGLVSGVVCHEDVAGPREWSEKQAGFASAVADMLTILGQQAERFEMRAAMDAQRQHLLQAQKMQALSKLGRVVVHDLANIMTIVSSRATLLALEPDIDKASRELSEAISYGNRLLRQLREFYDEKVPESGVEVVKVIASMENTLRATLGKEIDFKFSSTAAPTILPMAPIEVEQMVLNLCVNAKDAISGRGEVELTVSSGADRLTIEVRDTGVGMSEEQQSRLFEPYFSTKPGHSGIGLAAVFGIVARAQGRIEVESAPGHGATFRITLPFAGEAVSLDDPWSF